MGLSIARGPDEPASSEASDDAKKYARNVGVDKLSCAASIVKHMRTPGIHPA
jgi:hypothetical protein